MKRVVWGEVGRWIASVASFCRITTACFPASSDAVPMSTDPVSH